MNLQLLIEGFRSLRVAVIGDAILDRYIEGRTTRLCREAPVPIVEATGVRNLPGGGANVAANCAALGAKTSFVSMLGDDLEGRALARSLHKMGVRLLTGTCRGRRTAAKTRFLADGQLIMRLDDTDTAAFSEARRWEHLITQAFLDHEVVILSDYDSGAFGPRSMAHLGRVRRDFRGILAADSRKKLRLFAPLAAQFMKPNFLEALGMLGIQALPSEGRPELIRRKRSELLKAAGCGVLAVTMDREGAVVFERDGAEHYTPTVPVTNSKANGAGDAYLSIFTLALASSAPVAGASELAALGAQLALAQEGTSVCSAEALLAEVGGRPKVVSNPALLGAKLAQHRAKGQRIVFTNGCFDMLHAGNLSCLRRAKRLGDVLLVGVNSDASVRRLKGPGRPVNKIGERLKLLSALDCVDYLVSFDEDTACRLVEYVRPDILVKGADYSSSTLPEARVMERLGGKVVILPLLDTESTSGILARIRDAAAETPPETALGSGTPR